MLVQADLAEPGSIERLWREATRLGPVDALINNAGIFPDHPPLASSYDEWTRAWERTLAVNLVGAAHLSYCAARAMSARGQGRIVSVSSRAAFRGEPTAPAYAASKAGLNAFSQSLAKALAAHGVYVFVVAPGWVATQRVARAVRDPAVIADQPLGRVASRRGGRAGGGLLRARCAGQHDGRDPRCERRVVPAQLGTWRAAPRALALTSYASSGSALTGAGGGRG